LIMGVKFLFIAQSITNIVDIHNKYKTIIFFKDNLKYFPK